MSNTHKMGESLKVSAKLKHARMIVDVHIFLVLRACWSFADTFKDSPIL